MELIIQCLILFLINGVSAAMTLYYIREQASETKVKIPFIIAEIVLVCLSVLFFCKNHNLIIPVAVFAALQVLFVIFAFPPLKGKNGLKTLGYIVSMALGTGINYIFIRYISGVSLNNINIFYAMYIIFLTYAAIFCVLQIYTKLFLSEKIGRYGILIYVYAIIQIQYILLGIGMSVFNANGHHALFLTIVGTMSFLLVYLLSKYMQKQIRTQRSAEFIDEQLVLRKRHMDEMDIQSINMEKFKQNFISEIENIRRLNKENSRDEVRKTLNALTEKMDGMESIKYTNNPAIDSIIYFKHTTAEGYGIDMKINTQGYHNTAVSDVDVCSVISNLLDNAIEACQREKEAKYIDFNMRTSHGFLIIGIKNPCSDYSAKTRKEKPEEHGIGSLIVDDIIHRYNGSIDRNLSNNEFTVTAMLSEGI